MPSSNSPIESRQRRAALLAWAIAACTPGVDRVEAEWALHRCIQESVEWGVDVLAAVIGLLGRTLPAEDPWIDLGCPYEPRSLVDLVGREAVRHPRLNARTAPLVTPLSAESCLLIASARDGHRALCDALGRLVSPDASAAADTLLAAAAGAVRALLARHACYTGGDDLITVIARHAERPEAWEGLVRRHSLTGEYMKHLADRG